MRKAHTMIVLTGFVIDLDCSQQFLLVSCEGLLLLTVKVLSRRGLKWL